MTHRDSPYRKIAVHFDEGAWGAPKGKGGDLSEAFIDYLKLVYTPEEAEIVQHLKMMNHFTTTAEVCKATGRDEEDVKPILDDLLGRSYILGMEGIYALPDIPILVNLHHLRQKLMPEDVEAARLYQQFFIEEGFSKYYQSTEKGTPLMRVIPVEHTLQHGQKILDTEEAHRIIEAQSHMALFPCPCRTRTEKMGSRECTHRNPVGACVATGDIALHFERVGLGRSVTKEEAKKHLDDMQEMGLVVAAENYADHTHIICTCCDCCCSQVRGRTKWGNQSAMAPSNYVAEVGEDCVACGTCVDRCFFDAIRMDEEENRAVVDPSKCMGCGVCAPTCPEETLKLKRVERSQPFSDREELLSTMMRENKGVEV